MRDDLVYPAARGSTKRWLVGIIGVAVLVTGPAVTLWYSLHNKAPARPCMRDGEKGTAILVQDEGKGVSASFRMTDNSMRICASDDIRFNALMTDETYTVTNMVRID